MYIELSKITIDGDEKGKNCMFSNICGTQIYKYI